MCEAWHSAAHLSRQVQSGGGCPTHNKNSRGCFVTCPLWVECAPPRARPRGAGGANGRPVSFRRAPRGAFFMPFRGGVNDSCRPSVAGWWAVCPIFVCSGGLVLGRGTC